MSQNNNKSYSETEPDISPKALAELKRNLDQADKVDKKRAHSRAPNRAQTKDPKTPAIFHLHGPNPNKICRSNPKNSSTFRVTQAEMDTP